MGTLRVPYRDEWIVAYEARVAEQTSVELSYLRKEYHDQIEDTCINNSWAWGDGDRPSLDDPSTWTDEAACTASVRANIDGMKRDHEAFILRVASRARPWFHLVGSYTYSRTLGNSSLSSPYTGFGTGTFLGNEFDFFPTNFVNLDGNLALLRALPNMTVLVWAKGWPGTWNPFVSKHGEAGLCFLYRIRHPRF